MQQVKIVIIDCITKALALFGISMVSCNSNPALMLLFTSQREVCNVLLLMQQVKIVIIDCMTKALAFFSISVVSCNSNPALMLFGGLFC